MLVDFKTQEGFAAKSWHRFVAKEHQDKQLSSVSRGLSQLVSYASGQLHRLVHRASTQLRRRLTSLSVSPSKKTHTHKAGRRGDKGREGGLGCGKVGETYHRGAEGGNERENRDGESKIE